MVPVVFLPALIMGDYTRNADSLSRNRKFFGKMFYEYDNLINGMIVGRICGYFELVSAV